MIAVLKSTSNMPLDILVDAMVRVTQNQVRHELVYPSRKIEIVKYVSITLTLTNVDLLFNSSLNM